MSVSYSVNLTHMIDKILQNAVDNRPKSILLLGPRQVFKSTLSQRCNPDLTINLADEEVFVSVQGEYEQNFDHLGIAVSFQTFLKNILPSL